MADGDYQRLAPACPCGVKLAPYAGRGRPPKFCVSHRTGTKAKKAPRKVGRQLEDRTCVRCGAGFSRYPANPQRYCSKICQIAAMNDAAKTRRQRVCETCSKVFGTYSRNTERRWCSEECKPKALRGLFSCLHCGHEYRKKHRPPGQGEKFCTRECAFAAKAVNAVRGICTYIAGRCRTCGEAGGQRRLWTHCDACKAAKRRADAREASRLQGELLHRAAARVTACDECGSTFCPLYGASNSTLCQGCALVRKRAAKMVRKALHRGVGAEMVDWVKVCERDRWRCQLCGIKTPRAKRGTYDDNAPEIDHIVPLSKGGAHRYTNVQCACRRCNAAKSDKPLGQLLLIG